MPVHFVFGNHDYEVNCNPEQTSYPHELTHRLFEHFFDASPYAAIDHKGWKFLLTNGQLGPTWSIGHEQCDTQFASYGEEQLDWIAGHLDEGAPTVVLSHYMRLVTAEDGAESSPGGLFPLLDSVSNVQAVLVGHTHRWIDLGLKPRRSTPRTRGNSIRRRQPSGRLNFKWMETRFRFSTTTNASISTCSKPGPTMDNLGGSDGQDGGHRVLFHVRRGDARDRATLWRRRAPLSRAPSTSAYGPRRAAGRGFQRRVCQMTDKWRLWLHQRSRRTSRQAFWTSRKPHLRA